MKLLSVWAIAWLTWSSAAAAVEVTGFVMEAAGGGAGGAQVAVLDPVWQVQPHYWFATADAEGHFSVALPEGRTIDAAQILAVGPAGVGGAQWTAGEEATIVLAGFREVHGQVVDAQGKPLAGATVSLNNINVPTSDGADTEGPLSFTWPASAPWPQPTATTDADGAWSFDRLPTEGGTLVISHPAHVSAFNYFTAVEETPEAVTVMQSGGQLRGRLVDGDGKPAAGAKVVALAAGAAYVLATAETAADGTYLISGLTQGLAIVTTLVPVGGQIAGPSEPVQPLANQVVEVPDLELVPAGRLVVKAIDAASGAPLPGANVNGIADELPFTLSESIFTGVDGTVVIYGKAGPVSLWVDPPVPYINAQTDQVTSHLAVGPTPQVVTFRFERGHFISGSVLEAGGAPVAEVQVSAKQPGLPIEPTTTTDAHGHFDLGLISADRELEVTVSHYYGVQRYKGQINTASALADGLNLTVPALPKLDLRGRVIDDQARGVADANLSVMASGEDGSSLEWTTTTSSADGSYVIEGAPKALAYTVTATHEGYRPAAEGRQVRTGSAELTDAVLQALSHKVAGIVRDLAGKPIRGATVLVAGLMEREAETDAKGSFRIENLPSGKLRLVAGAGGALLADQVVQADDLAVDLKLGRLSPPTLDQQSEFAEDLLHQTWVDTQDSDWYARADLPLTLATIDPSTALSLVSNLTPGSEAFDETAFRTLVGLLVTNPEAALPALDLIGKVGPSTRSRLALAAAALLLNADRDSLAREQVALATGHADSPFEAALRAVVGARLGDGAARASLPALLLPMRSSESIVGPLEALAVAVGSDEGLLQLLLKGCPISVRDGLSIALYNAWALARTKPSLAAERLAPLWDRLAQLPGGEDYWLSGLRWDTAWNIWRAQNDNQRREWVAQLALSDDGERKLLAATDESVETVSLLSTALEERMATGFRADDGPVAKRLRGERAAAVPAEGGFTGPAFTTDDLIALGSVDLARTKELLASQQDEQLRADFSLTLAQALARPPAERLRRAYAESSMILTDLVHKFLGLEDGGD